MSLELSNISSILNGSGAPSSFDEKNPRSIAAKVQAMFMEVMIKTMEETVGAQDGLFGGSSSSEIYRGMFREQMAAQLGAHLGGPLSQLLEKGLVKDPGDVVKPELTTQPHEALPEARTLPVSGVVTSEVGWRKDPINGHLSLHKGTDIAAKTGTPIQAVADGTVIESGAKGTFGNAVVIQTDDGRRMLYAHNQQNFVRVGDRVVRGDAIAAVGATGRATGPHVHFEVLE